MTEYLPGVFAFLMALAIVVYAILDGYDLGVGILLPMDDKARCDKMIASIGPFWDANETWLVLAVGILLIAFPAAHSVLLRELYLPIFIMLIGLILRGVAFDFRVKAAVQWQSLWNQCFKAGSIIAAASQGFMLGLFVMGFNSSVWSYAFASLSAFCVCAAYAYIGGAWLVLKTEGQLQKTAAQWTRKAGLIAGLGVLSVSLINPIVNNDVATRWFSGAETVLLLMIPLTCFTLFAVVDNYLRHVPHSKDFGCWIPFVSVALIFFLAFQGLAYSFFPYVVPGELTIWQAASSPKSLSFVFWGVLIVVPAIIFYTAFAYRVFWGKAEELSYY